jgi:hypothetical protein
MLSGVEGSKHGKGGNSIFRYVTRCSPAEVNRRFKEHIVSILRAKSKPSKKQSRSRGKKAIFSSETSAEFY